MRVVLAVLSAFLAGSIPFGLLLVRAVRGHDLRSSGSGNIGATNALRTGGLLPGLMTLVLDIGKGAGGYWLGTLVAGKTVPVESGLSALFVFAPVAGHVLSPWLKFRGGKGVATFLGALLAADFRLALAAGLAFLALALLTRMASAGSLAAVSAATVGALLLHGGAPLPFGILAASALIFARHWENLQRMRAGTERRIGTGDAT